MNPATPKTGRPPATRLCDVVFRGSMMSCQAPGVGSASPTLVCRVRWRRATLVRAVLSAGLLVLRGNAAVAVELGVTLLPSNQQVQVTLTGGTGRWHRLEASTNLLNWSAMTNFYQTNPSSTWLDASVTNTPQRYYRSRDLTTALDLYVAAPDTNYSYTLLSTIPGTGQTTYVLELRSQAWLTTNEVDRTLWKHWLIIVKPSVVTNSQSLLFIDGGSNPGTQPTSADPILSWIAVDTGSVVTHLKMVPNEPLTFVGETSSRTEDSLITYTWDKYLRTGDPKWPARLPMTKAAVRAMDTVTSFCATNGGGLNIDKFVVSGGSKRGWTSWTTAAVDRRVAAIIPASIDVLNVEACLTHQYSAYGFWAPAIQDYVDMGIVNWTGTNSPEFQALMDIEDPYAYRARLTMPKFEIWGSGDQYFLPDSSQFYFNDLPGVKYMRCMPNADHSLNFDAYVTLKGCYQSILFQTPLPQFSWTLQASNVIRVVATDLPTTVTLWQATNSIARDFRLATIGAAWTSGTLTDQGGGVYVGTVTVPPAGWKAFFVELTYARPGLETLKFTTLVYVVPDTLPYHWPL
jgi:PhoPQ-activated pathogenicity-related protein